MALIGAGRVGVVDGRSGSPEGSRFSLEVLMQGRDLPNFGDKGRAARNPGRELGWEIPEASAGRFGNLQGEERRGCHPCQ